MKFLSALKRWATHAGASHRSHPFNLVLADSMQLLLVWTLFDGSRLAKSCYLRGFIYAFTPWSASGACLSIHTSRYVVQHMLRRCLIGVVYELLNLASQSFASYQSCTLRPLSVEPGHHPELCERWISSTVLAYPPACALVLCTALVYLLWLPRFHTSYGLSNLSSLNLLYKSFDNHIWSETLKSRLG